LGVVLPLRHRRRLAVNEIKTPARWIFTLTAILAASPVLPADVPLPPDVAVVAPAPEIRPELTQLSGRWAGNWSGKLDAILVVEKIDNESATVIYAYGDSSAWNIKRGYRRFVASVSTGATPSISFDTGSVFFVVTLIPNSSAVTVHRKSPTSSLTETFKKVFP
jgi:hypothetical protein